MARIVINGYMIRHPVAGNTMAYLHYVLGFARLGHEVVYVEESGWPNSCYDPYKHEMGDDPSTGMAVVSALARQYGLELPLYYVNRDTQAVHGGEWSDLTRHLDAADLLLNVGGVCWLPDFLRCQRRAYVDMDPGFTQLGRFGAEAVANHQVHFTYGANFQQPDCSIPDDGIDWRPTVPPVVTDLWNGAVPAEPADSSGKLQNGSLTTITNWNPYGSVTHGGRRFGQKDEEFLRILELPRRTSQAIELTLSGAGADVEQRLRTAGWRIRPAREVSSHFRTYHAYIMGSRGEFSVAKHGYVVTRSGWFSDRSVCYLAAGRPTILQDTGFSSWLPTGRGVLAFSNLEEAVGCIDALNADYAGHCTAAREIAETTFGYRAVLPRLLDQALGGPASSRA